jgi:hypothetical protein
MIMKLKKRPEPTGVVEPAKKKSLVSHAVRIWNLRDTTFAGKGSSLRNREFLKLLGCRINESSSTIENYVAGYYLPPLHNFTTYSRSLSSLLHPAVLSKESSFHALKMRC